MLSFAFAMMLTILMVMARMAVTWTIVWWRGVIGLGDGAYGRACATGV
jgi:hypothetical protein